MTVIPNTSKAKIWNARFVVDISWSGKEAHKPIIPRDELKQVDLNITLRVDTGDSFGKAVLETYEKAIPPVYGVILLEILDSKVITLGYTIYSLNLFRDAIKDELDSYGAKKLKTFKSHSLI